MLKILGRFSIIVIIFLSSCSTNKFANEIGMDKIAESYVKLVLKVGLYDSDYVMLTMGPKNGNFRKSKMINRKNFRIVN